MSKSYSSVNRSSSFNTLDRELHVRNNHLNKNIPRTSSEQFREMSIQSNQINSTEKPRSVKQNQRKTNQEHINNSNTQKTFSNTPRISKQIEPNMDKKIKYFEVSNTDFVDFNSKGVKLGQNYNTELDNDLRFSESTRRKTLPKKTMSMYKNISRDTSLDTKNGVEKNISKNNKFINNLVSTDTRLRANTATSNDNIMAINSNLINDIAAKVAKASPDYWDNTRRRNLDTSVYVSNPKKNQGRGFGDIDTYDLFMNGVGTATRQDNPDLKPQNIEDDRIYMTNHNYNYDKFHVTEMLPCGSDTRYLNKKIL